MNLEIVKKHKHVMLWWMDNLEKGVVCKTDDGWSLQMNPEFHINKTYVKNDKYVDLRIALGNGHHIEKKSGGIWLLILTNDVNFKFNDLLKNYRVQSEQIFNVNDWVLNSTTGEKFKIYDIESRDDGVYCSNGCTYVKIIPDMELWKPKRNEMCVFWNNNVCDEYTIGRYLRKNSDNIFMTESYWDNCTPLEFLKIITN